MLFFIKEQYTNPNKSNVYSMTFIVTFVGFSFIATSLFALFNYKNIVWGQDVNKLREEQVTIHK